MGCGPCLTCHFVEKADPVSLSWILDYAQGRQQPWWALVVVWSDALALPSVITSFHQVLFHGDPGSPKTLDPPDPHTPVC